MDVMQAIKERRSIRKYRTDPVTDEMLQTVLEAARWAPSWANTQCWRLIVVRDPETRRRLSETVSSTNPPGRNGAADAVRDAPVLIVACAEPGRAGAFSGGERRGSPATDKGEWWYMFDLGLAMQNLTLATHALGLGTVHVGMFDAAQAAAIVGTPRSIVVVELMPLGWPDESPSPRPRKEVNQFVSYERYSEPLQPK